MQTPTEALEGRWREEDRGFATPCWIWQRGKTVAGYPEACAGGRVVYAHRVAYELHIGPIPERHDVHHRCEQRACLNPDHLLVVAHDEHAGAAGHGKLTLADARAVRVLARVGLSHREIAESFGICRPLVSMIASRKRWARA